MLTLKEIFEKNKNIIINTDIDGILSGAILQTYYGCKIVGFSNSDEKVWVSPEIVNIYQPVYIDMYVNKPEVICIDQHIISYDKEHHNKIKSYKTKINPNIEFNRTFKGDMDGGFAQKYPFGTVHYLIALMVKDGIQVDFPRLHSNIKYKGENFTFIHLLLRADAALQNSLKYKKNTNEWWELLLKSKSEVIKTLKEYVKGVDLIEADKYSESVGTFLKEWSNIRKEYEEYKNCESCAECNKCKKYGKRCEGSTDGSFFNICKGGKVLDKFLNYIKTIGEMIDIELDIPDEFSTYKGVSQKIHTKDVEIKDILNTKELFSYAFIYSPQNKYKENFSYTIDME